MVTRLTGFILLTGLTAAGHSVAASGPELIKQLLDSGKVDEAYTLAVNYLAGHEGDPEFDFQYGVAAIDSGNISEGVFALERVAFSDPKNPLVRLELARGYYLLEQYSKSKQLFEQVLELQPPENVRIRISRYLGFIEQRQAFPVTKVKSFVEIWRGLDSNINSAPGNQTEVVTLSSDALGRGDHFNRLRLGASIEHRYAPNRQLDFSAEGDFRYYDSESDQDYSSVSLNGGHSWTEGKHRYRLGAVWQHFSKDGSGYRDLLGLNASWKYTPDQESLIRVYGGIGQLNYDEISWRDATQAYLGGNYFVSRSGSWNPLWFAGLFAGQETPERSGILADAEVDRFFWGTNVGVQLQPQPDITLTPVLTYQSSRYGGVDWLYGVRREDDFAMLNLNLEWQVEPAWKVLANLSSIHAESNIELYDYDRQQAMLGLRYDFE